MLSNNKQIRYLSIPLINCSKKVEYSNKKLDNSNNIIMY